MNAKPQRLFLVMASIGAMGLALVTAYTRAQGTASISKSAIDVESVFTPIAREAGKSTVRVYVQDHGNTQAVALGTIISADGYILTKGSEVVGQERVLVNLARIHKPVEAQVVGWSEPLDLAMLKINASNLIPVTFADTRPPEGSDASSTTRAGGPGAGGRGGGRRGGFGGRGRLQPGPVVVPAVSEPLGPPEGAVPVVVGEWVATPDAVATIGQDMPPKYVGVISVTRRRIPPQNYDVYGPPFMGVNFGDDNQTGATKIVQVLEKTGASAAGIKGGDIITAINGRPIKVRSDLTAVIRAYNVGDAIIVSLERDSQTLAVRVVLGPYPLEQMDPDMEMLSGNVSGRTQDFPAVFQHDTLLEPVDCGGPLVDLEGRVIGINIARAGRTEAYALPADIIQAAIEPLKSGKMAPPAGILPATRPATQPATK